MSDIVERYLDTWNTVGGERTELLASRGFLDQVPA